MVGDNQHYLPQLLLRGFLSDHREEYAWEFRKGCVEKKPIARIAFGFRFYGEPGEETPDECLTDRETRYGRVIAQIRKAPRDLSIKISSSERRLLITMVIDTLKRTKHVRDFTKQIVNTIYKDTIKFERLVGRGTNNPISLLAVRKLIDAFGERLESIVDERHSKASGEPVSPDSMFRRYWRFTWSIGIFPSGSFILGDFGPLVMCGPELILNIAFSHTEKARAILLPIAHDLLLVGRSPGEEALQTPDPELINVATAELSREFFVSSQNGPQEARYLEHLGRRADEERG